jgi:hypothetical protein
MITQTTKFEKPNRGFVATINLSQTTKQKDAQTARRIEGQTEMYRQAERRTDR